MGSSFRFECELGQFVVTLRPDRAPATCAFFEEQFASPDFAEATIFRIVNAGNTSMRHDAPIEVVQLGIDMTEAQITNTITHENTLKTGLVHKRGAVSAARFEIDSAYPSFFVCMRDEPVLDFGGARHEDGQGFAVFGEISEGMDVIDALFARAEPTDYLAAPIPITCSAIS